MKQTIYLGITLVATLILTSFAGSARPDNKLVINAVIKGLGNDSVSISIYPVDRQDEEFHINKQAVCTAEDKFSFETEADSPVFIRISPNALTYTSRYGENFMLPSGVINLIAAPGDNIEIEAHIKDKAIYAGLRGSKLVEDISELRALELPYDIKSDSVIAALETGEEIDDKSPLLSRRREALDRKKEIYKNFIEKNPDAELSAYIIEKTEFSEFPLLYEKLGENAKNGIFRQYLAKTSNRYDEQVRRNKAKESIVAGADAPDFTLKTPDGGTLALTDIKDKHIVLDFWGAWCGWCIKGFPKMKEYYAKYGDKVEFVGIDSGDTESKWLEALKENELPWLQTIDDKNDKATVKYAISAFPTKILIDKDYKIVEIVVGERESFYEKLDELFGK